MILRSCIKCFHQSDLVSSVSISHILCSLGKFCYLQLFLVLKAFHTFKHPYSPPLYIFFIIIPFQEGQNYIQKCAFSISLHNTCLSFNQQFIQKRTFVPWHLSISRSLQQGMCSMAFINPGE